MADPLPLFWLLMEAQDATLSAYAATMWPAGIHRALLSLGFLREAENAARIVCPECFDHEEEVLVRPGPDGELRYAIPCPQVLRAEVSPDDLRQWRVDFSRFAELMADKLQLGGKCTELAPGRIWRLGRWTYQGMTRDMLLARGLDRPDAIEFRRAITAAKQPVVFVPSSEPDPGFWRGKTPPLIRMSEIATLVGGQVALDTSQIVGLVHDADTAIPASEEAMSGHTLSFVLNQKVRSAIKSQLTDDQIIQAYVANDSSARQAAKYLGGRGFSIHHSTISRTVQKYQEVLQSGSSESVVRSRSVQRRDGKPMHSGHTATDAPR